MHATALVPTDAHPLPHFETAHLRAHPDDAADDLVAGNKRVLADAPIVIDQ
ncbi:hypothetical protein D3C87_1167300 [compost metagenome]